MSSFADDKTDRLVAERSAGAVAAALAGRFVEGRADVGRERWFELLLGVEPPEVLLDAPPNELLPKAARPGLLERDDIV